MENTLHFTAREKWKEGVRQTSKGEVQRFLYRVCGCRFSEPIVEVNVAGKVCESFHSGEDYHKVGITSGNASNEEVNDCLSFVSGEDVSSHEVSIVEKSFNGLPFYDCKLQV